MATKRDSVVRGTLVITVATLVARIMGAIYKPIVIRMFAPFDPSGGNAGIGMAWAAVQAYQIVLAFTAVGFNVAISKLVAERLSLGDEAGAKKVFRTSMWLMGTIGLLGALFFWFGAGWLEAVTKTPGTAAGYMGMAPALVLVSLMAAYRGVFQGFQSMTPNAYSQLLEALFRIITGLVLVHLLVSRSVPLAAGGFNFGDAVGGAVGLAYLWWLYQKNKATMWREGVAAATLGRNVAPALSDFGQTTGQVIRAILRIGLPIALIGAAQPIMGEADLFTLGHSLVGTTMDVNDIFGQLTNALTIVLLPATFTLALYTSLVPAIAESTVVGRKDQAQSLTRMAYRLTTLVGWPAMVGLFVLGVPIYNLIYNAEGGWLLSVLAVGTLVVMLQQTSSGILQGMGRIMPPVINLLTGTAIKLLGNLVLVPLLGPAGAAWSTVIGFTVSAAMNLISVYRYMGAGLDFKGSVVKPGLAALIMGLVVWGLDTLIGPLGTTLGSRAIVMLFLIAAGAGAYGVALLLVRGIPREDLERVPRIGRRLSSLLTRYRLLSPQ